MVRSAAQDSTLMEAFDEQQFYLDEFRGHTLVLSVPESELAGDRGSKHLTGIVRTLLLNETRVVLLISTPDRANSDRSVRALQRRLTGLIVRDELLRLFPDRRGRAAAFRTLAPDALDTPQSALEVLTGVWASLRRGPLFVGLLVGASVTETTVFAQHVAARLRVHKLVLFEPDGGISGGDGKQLSFMDENMLATLLSAGQAEWAGLASRRATLEAVRAALIGGVTSVNLCRLTGAARELFTYEGSGTLFTLADYCAIQRLGIDDFAEVEGLIERGQREGILKVRTPDEIGAMLVTGYGAAIGAHHLAGVCALTTVPYAADAAGEIVGLYTITRFKGEGVGGRLVARVLEEARALDLAYVFACTTESRAQAFFERQGFRRVLPTQIPAAKWKGYDPARRTKVAVFRLDLQPSGTGEAPA